MNRVGWTDEMAGWYSCLHGEERQDRMLDDGGREIPNSLHSQLRNLSHTITFDCLLTGG